MAERVLDVVGVDESEETIYRLLLERSAASVAEISTALGSSASEVRTVLRRLERQGLVNRLIGKPDRFVPAPPEAAIEVLVLNRQRDLERVRLAAKTMETAFRASRPTHPSPLDVVEVVLGRDAVAQRFDQIVLGTRKQLRVFDRPPYVGDPSTPDDLELELLGRGITNRVIYDADSLSFPGRLATLRILVEAGERARTLPTLPMKLFIFDDQMAFIPLSLDEPGMEGALLVQPSPVLDALITLFETLWDRAEPVGLSEPQRGRREDHAAGMDEDLVVLLASGLKDQAVARQLGVAPRTVLRRVADLMHRLGAQTRFQAGWLAAKRAMSR